MKIVTPRRICAASAIAAAAALLPQAAFAAGVPAGTLIENTASASYTSGGPAQTINSNTVTVRVDELLDVTVTSQDASPVPINGSSVLTYLVTNTGNGPETFRLTADPAVTGNDFEAAIDNLAIDTNGNGVYDPGVDTLIASGGTSPSIDPDNSLTVFVLFTAPGGLNDGDTSQVRLTAISTTGSGTPGTVIAGAGEGGGDAVVGSSGAVDNALGPLVASVAAVTLTKSASVLDPFGGSQPVPGATITYTLVATVGGSGSVSNLTLSDNFPTSTTYSPNSITLEGSALTDAADADAGSASATGISVNAGTVAPGSTRTVTFNVTIDN